MRRAGIAIASLVLVGAMLGTPPARAIYNGHDVVKGAQPFVVSVHTGATPSTSNLLCGGALVAPQWVMTAKHCLDTNQDGTIGTGEHQPTALWFSIGRTVISDTSTGATVRGSSVALNANNDLALVKLANPTSAGRVIQLATDLPPNGTSLWASGWGGTTASTGAGTASNNLKTANFTVNGTSTTSGPDVLLQPETGVNLCQRDEGGPLFSQSGTVFTLVGVVTSSPAGCGVNTGVTRASRVDAALAWVRARIPADFAFVDAWNNSASSPYTPNSFYSYSSGGGTITISHTSVGRYTVTLPNLGAVTGGNVELVAEQSTFHCQVVNWGPSGADLLVKVACNDLSGAANDEQFVMQYYRAGAGDPHQAAYVWANGPTTSSYTPSLAYNFNSRGGTNTITRNSTGVYTVNLPGFTTSGGNVAVTAYGPTPTTYCKVSSWGTAAVTVRCFNFAGSPADSKFAMRYTDKEVAARVGTKGAYAWANDPTSTSYTPSATYRWHYSGDTFTAGATGVGAYTVHLPGFPSSYRRGALVTAYGTSPNYCALVGDTIDGSGGANVLVQCYAPSGAAVNSQFTFSLETNA